MTDYAHEDLLKKTKIVATIGPGSEDEETFTALAKNGLNVARLNFSHDTHETHIKRINLAHKISKELNKPIAVLQDLQGPKIRLGILRNSPMKLEVGEKVKLKLAKEQDDDALPIQFNIFSTLKENDRVLIRDGMIRLAVTKVGKDSCECVCKVGGEFKDKQGINVPDTKMPNVSFTEKDQADLLVGLEHKVDFVALSFVQEAEDIRYLRSIIAKHSPNHQPKIVAKIETREALKNLKAIIQEADAIMVARGDLAVEVGQEDVPIWQREMLKMGRKYHRPVIVATQMLESMINSPVPTRAEVNDVATAVIDHADAVMLSGETAYGDFPVETISTMKSIIKRVERHHHETMTEFAVESLEESNDQTTAIAAAAALLSHQLKAKMIVVATTTGKTAMRIGAYRPPVAIASITDNETTYRQLALSWGIKAFYHPHLKKSENGLAEILTEIKEKGYVHADDTVVCVTGEQPGEEGGTNIIKVEKI